MSPSKEERVLSLRPHHGMCLAYYQGYGYSEDFTRHTDQVMACLLENPTVRLTVSTDEVCSACPKNSGGRCINGDKVARHDWAVLEACGLSEGDTLPFLTFARLVQEELFDSGKRETVCRGCQWAHLCVGPGRWAGLGRDLKINDTVKDI